MYARAVEGSANSSRAGTPLKGACSGCTVGLGSKYVGCMRGVQQAGRGWVWRTEQRCVRAFARAFSLVLYTDERVHVCVRMYACACIVSSPPERVDVHEALECKQDEQRSDALRSDLDLSSDGDDEAAGRGGATGGGARKGPRCKVIRSAVNTSCSEQGLRFEVTVGFGWGAKRYTDPRKSILMNPLERAFTCTTRCSLHSLNALSTAYSRTLTIQCV